MASAQSLDYAEAGAEPTKYPVFSSNAEGRRQLEEAKSIAAELEMAAQTPGGTASVVAATPHKSTASNMSRAKRSPTQMRMSQSTGSMRASAQEAHWKLVMTKLAPNGQRNSPLWQKNLFARVEHAMTRKTRSEETKSVINPAGLSNGFGVPAAPPRTTLSAAFGIQVEPVAEEPKQPSRPSQRKTQQKNLPPLARSSSGPPPATPAARSPAATSSSQELEAALTAESKSTSAAALFAGAGAAARAVSPVPQVGSSRERKLREKEAYMRSIQREQLLEQQWLQDLRSRKDEVARFVADREKSRTFAQQCQRKLQKQAELIEERCKAVASRADQAGAINSERRREIDALRQEKELHITALHTLQRRASKMDVDINYLTTVSHLTLDIGDKTQGRLRLVQRDNQHEQRAALQELQTVTEETRQVEGEFQARDHVLNEEAELRRRAEYARSRARRGAKEGDEHKLGYLLNQVKGLEGEFERLRRCTKMDARFEPGKNDLVEEMISRFLEKEAANASMLNYLQQQQDTMRQLEEMTEAMVEEQAAVQAKIDEGPEARWKARETDMLKEEGEIRDELLMLDRKSTPTEARLRDLCEVVERSLRALYPSAHKEGGGAVPVELEGECRVVSLLEWLRLLEERLADMQGVFAHIKQQGEPPSADSLVVQWSAAPEGPPKELPNFSMSEYHEALLEQAEQRKQRREMEEADDDNEGADGLMAEAALPRRGARARDGGRGLTRPQALLGSSSQLEHLVDQALESVEKQHHSRFVKPQHARGGVSSTPPAAVEEIQTIAQLPKDKKGGQWLPAI